MRRRALLAAVIVAAIVVAPIAVDHFALPVKVASLALAQADSDGGEDALSLLDRKTQEGSVQGERGLLEGLSKYFEDEAFSLKGRHDLRVGGRGCVLGFLEDGSAEGQFNRYAKQLVGAGWMQVPSGQKSSGSFVKKTGRLRWMFLACTKVADRVSVVAQCSGDDEEGE